MEKFVPLRVLAGLCLALAVAACASEGPNPRAANIAPPPPPPNPLQAQAPQQAAPQQQMVQPQQMTPQQQQRPQQQAQAQPRASANAGSSGGLAMGGHLASHKSMEAAEAAWQALVRRQPALQQLRPYFVPVMVRGEPWVRLVAGDFPDRDEVNRFCNWARAQQLYCAPMPLAGASLENPSSIMSGGGASNNSAPAASRQRQPRPTAPPQSGLNDALPVPAPAAPPTPVAAAPALVAPAPNANNVPAQPLAPPLPPRRQATNPSLPQ